MRPIVAALLLLLLHAPAHAAGMLLAVATDPEARDVLRAGAAGVAGVQAVAEVGRRQLWLVRSRTAQGAVVHEAPAGFRYPLDAMFFEPAAYARLLEDDAAAPMIRSLRQGDALLGESAARLRNLGIGGRLELADGTVLTVRGVVPDTAILNREVALGLPGYQAATGDRRTLWLRYDGPMDAIAERLAALLPTDAPLRIRALDDSDFVEGYAPVLPQARLKLALGEFAFRPVTATAFVRDPRWEAANLVMAEVPLLGRVRCHRLVVPALAGAMTELIAKGLADLIAPQAFRGCDNPRLIGEGPSLSRHAWGAAVDLNVSRDPAVRANAFDPRLVAVMARWGFLSGHLFNDPGHFEYVGPPAE